jgi:type VI secretion system protein VasD
MAVVLLVTACASAPEMPKPPPSVPIRLSVSASQDANPDPSGRPSPVVVRILQLTDTVAFGEASYDALTADANAALKGALKGEARTTIRPGEQLELPMAIDPEAKSLGFIGEYTDLLGSVWKVSFSASEGALGEGLVLKPVRLAVTRAALRIEPQR